MDTNTSRTKQADALLDTAQAMCVEAASLLAMVHQDKGPGTDYLMASTYARQLAGHIGEARLRLMMAPRV